MAFPAVCLQSQVGMGAMIGFLSSSSYKATNPIDVNLYPTLMTSFSFNYLLKAPSPIIITLGLIVSFSGRIWGGTIQFMATTDFIFKLRPQCQHTCPYSGKNNHFSNTSNIMLSKRHNSLFCEYQVFNCSSCCPLCSPSKSVGAVTRGHFVF